MRSVPAPPRRSRMVVTQWQGQGVKRVLINATVTSQFKLLPVCGDISIDDIHALIPRRFRRLRLAVRADMRAVNMHYDRVIHAGFLGRQSLPKTSFLAR